MKLTLRQKTTLRYAFPLLLAAGATGIVLAQTGTDLPVAPSDAAAADAPGAPGANERPPQAASEARVLPVETARVERQNGFRIERSYTGEVRARRTTDLGFERSARLVRVVAREGERVAAGAPVAELDLRRLNARLAELRARRRAADAELDKLRAGPRTETIASARAVLSGLEEELALWSLKADRREKLIEANAIASELNDEAASRRRSLAAQCTAARAQVEELETGSRVEDVAAQEARLAQLDAEIELLEIDRTDSVLRAPFAGSVGALFVEEGTIVQPGMPVLRLVESGALEVWVGLPVDVAQRLEPGSSHALRTDGVAFQGTLRCVLPELDRTTRTRTAIFEVAADSTQRAVFPGRTVRLVLEHTVDTPGFWVPTAALVASARGLWSCYAIVGDGAPDAGTVERREVEVLHPEGDRAFVRGLLSSGDVIVAGGTHRIVPGQRVRRADR